MQLSMKKELDNNYNKRLSWNEMYMTIAKVVALRSKDPHTKVGCVLVKDNKILSIGYNAEPKNFTYKFNWNTSEKYNYVIHAELNALANASLNRSDIEGSTLYITLSPCHDCIKMLIQYGIKKVYYLEKYKDIELTENIANHANIQLINFISINSLDTF